jgi:hypothetical protein
MEHVKIRELDRFNDCSILKKGRLKPLTREDAIRKDERRTGVPDRREYRTMIVGKGETRSKSAR